MQRKLKFQILPANQTRLGLLCGPINSTLKQIEDALNIKISNRGSNFKLKGDKINIEAGKVVLENLYDKSVDGDIISPEEVHLYLREVMNFKNNSLNSMLLIRMRSIFQRKWRTLTKPMGFPGPMDHLQRCPPVPTRRNWRQIGIFGFQQGINYACLKNLVNFSC